MLKFVIPLLALVAGLGAGAGAAFMLAPKSGETGEATVEEHDVEDVVEDGAPTDFAELGNQFVVPVVRNGAVASLVVMSITVEVTAGSSDQVFAIEPRLRDAFLQVMFDHANLGGFDDSFTAAERMSVLRQGLREVARRQLGTVVRDVLITDIVRQEV